MSDRHRTPGPVTDEEPQPGDLIEVRIKGSKLWLTEFDDIERTLVDYTEDETITYRLVLLSGDEHTVWLSPSMHEIRKAQP